jgi:hypothetical protein
MKPITQCIFIFIAGILSLISTAQQKEKIKEDKASQNKKREW